MATYRITRTRLRGQFESHICFLQFLAAAWSENKANQVEVFYDPANDGGPNDSAWVLWAQFAEVKVPESCNPDLMSVAGINGWQSEPEARTALAKLTGAAGAVNATVDAANKASLAKSVKADAAAAGEAVKSAAQAAAPALGAGLLGVTGLYVAGALAGAYGLYLWLTRGGRR